VLEMTGTSTWFSGKATCAPCIAGQAIGRPGGWAAVTVGRKLRKLRIALRRLCGVRLTSLSDWNSNTTTFGYERLGSSACGGR